MMSRVYPNDVQFLRAPSWPHAGALLFLVMFFEIGKIIQQLREAFMIMI